MKGKHPMTSICRFWILICQSKKKLLFTTLLTLFIHSNQALAQRSLSYKEAQNFKEKQALGILPEGDFVLARIDLNGDFIDEYIAKPQNCPPQTLCPHTILAFESQNPIVIGTFEAQKILILPEKTYGIHHLRVFNQALNDFAFQDAIWSPKAFLFEYLE